MTIINIHDMENLHWSISDFYLSFPEGKYGIIWYSHIINDSSPLLSIFNV